MGKIPELKDKFKSASPLRYPGGKTRALKEIYDRLPEGHIAEYREPFIGGGSVFTAFRQTHPSYIRYWLNDLNEDLVYFYQYAQARLPLLLDLIEDKKLKYEGRGRDLFKHLKKAIDNDERHHENSEYHNALRAARFFILNRITFSGTLESGGYSQQAFDRRFTASSIERITNFSMLLKSVRITCGDYQELIKASPVTSVGNVFLYLDPPYYSNQGSKLYGKNGHLHAGFNHKRLLWFLQRTQHKWLLSYDDCPTVRHMYADYNITEYNLQYGMNNYKQETAAKGGELLISNY